MLPERLSTDLTSLNQDEDRLAVVVAMTVRRDGTVADSALSRALVRNKAKLAYDSVAAWLDGHAAAAAGASPRRRRSRGSCACRTASPGR